MRIKVTSKSILLEIEFIFWCALFYHSFFYCSFVKYFYYNFSIETEPKIFSYFSFLFFLFFFTNNFILNTQFCSILSSIGDNFKKLFLFFFFEISHHENGHLFRMVWIEIKIADTKRNKIIEKMRSFFDIRNISITRRYFYYN